MTSLLLALGAVIGIALISLCITDLRVGGLAAHEERDQT